MRKDSKFTEQQALDLRARNMAGATKRALAEEHGVAYQTVVQAIQRANGGGRPRRGRPRKDRVIVGEGYVVIHADPADPYAMAMSRRAGATVYVLEHRLVMAHKLGRALGSGETVHHLDGDRTNNDPANLELRVGRHGRGATEAHCRTCTCFRPG